MLLLSELSKGENKKEGKVMQGASQQEIATEVVPDRQQIRST